MLFELKSNNKAKTDKNLHISKHTKNHLDVQAGRKYGISHDVAERKSLDLSQEA